MQNIELTSWLISTEVIFNSTSMSLIFLVMSLMLAHAFSVTYLSFNSGVSLRKRSPIYVLISSILIFASYSFMFLGGGYFLIISIVLLLSSITLNFYYLNSIRLAIAEGIGFIGSYLIACSLIVDYFDLHNAVVFLSVSLIPLICIFACKNIEHFDMAKLISGFIVFLSIGGYSFNVDRVLVSPSINAYHQSIEEDLNSGLDYNDLSSLYDAIIDKTTSDKSDVQISGLRNYFSALPLTRVQSSEVVRAQGEFFRVSSSNHATVIYSQAKSSALLMMIMPCFLWLLIMIFISIKHHSANETKRK